MNINLKDLSWLSRKRTLLIVLTVSMTLIGLAVYRFANQNKWLEDDYISQNELSRQNTLFEDLFLFIQTAESSVRGYAGTGNKEFIRDFKSTIDSIRINYRELKDFKPHKADAANNQLISSFDKLIAQKIEFMLQVKNLCDIGKRNEALSMIATERGIELTDSILKINEATKTALRGSLEESKNIFTRINKRTNNIAYLSITTSIILIIIVVYFLLTEIRKTRVISDQLELQKEHLRTTLFSIGEGLITTGNDGRIIYMNPAAERLTGWTNAEAKNKPLQDIYNVVNEESGKRIEHVVSRILKERKVVELENNTLLHTKNAGTLIISNNGSPILDTKGNILGAVLVFNDITEKKKTETELKESENQYRRLIENLPVAVFTCNKSGVINLYNKAIVELWGKKPVAGKEVWYDSLKLFNKDGNRIPDNENPMAFTLKDEKAYHGDEIIVQRPDGSVRHILPYPTPVFDAQGRLAGGVSVHIDLTEKKRAEEKIRKAVERYDILARATSDCIWDWDIENDSILYNDSMGNMFGYTRNDIKNGTAWWKSNIHPDDIALVSARLDEVFTKQIETTQLEYRYRCADNSYKYILDRSFVVYDENNKPVRMIGSMQDITSEKEQEKEIAKTIIDTQEKERQQVGMELHDNVNQLLTASLMYLKMAIKIANEKKELTEFLNNSIRYINDAIHDIRKLSHQLTPYSMDDISLKGIFEILTEAINKTKQLDITLNIDEFDKTIAGNDIQTNLYRILQEQMNNILKYSKADKVNISLKLLDKTIELRIKDNGIGFNPDTVQKGIGLQNIKRRTEIFSGNYKIISAQGKGCELIVTLPLISIT